MNRADTLLNSACEWAVSSPRRLAIAIAALIVAPHLIEGIFL